MEGHPDEPNRRGPGPVEGRGGLLNVDYATGVILRDAPWREGHAASATSLGLGALYYGIAYALRARTCVCLGSGGGFVPRIMKQAQRDLGLGAQGRTILVDANLPEAGWGSPRWLAEDSFFRTHFPDVEIRVETTARAAERIAREGLAIDFLHIDADHSYRRCKEDFLAYRPLMAPSYVITLHDTDMEGVDRVVEDLRALPDVDLVNLVALGRGLAIIAPRLPRGAPKLYEPFRS